MLQAITVYIQIKKALVLNRWIFALEDFFEALNQRES
jgi:hypothetical protein